MSKEKVYNDGQYESVKFAHRRADYYEGLNAVLDLGYSKEELIHHFSAFTGEIHAIKCPRFLFSKRKRFKF